VTLARFCMPGSHSLHLDVWAVPVGLKLQHAALDLLPPNYTQCTGFEQSDSWIVPQEQWSALLVKFWS